MKRTLLAASLAAISTAAFAQAGYLTHSNSGGGPVTTGDGLCVHTGFWTPDMAVAPCDAVPRAAVAPPAPVAQAEPAPAPQPLAEESPRGPVIEKVSLSTDVLFGFNKAELTPAGQQKLDELAKNAQGANVEKVVLIGHADRIGSEQYNKELSEQRAQAVADYLASKGVEQSRLQVEGRGESQPVTGAECSKLGKESNKNQKLISCLQPDRRVDAELLGSRESTASTGSTPSSSGATGTTGTGTGSSSGSGTNQ